jgi:Fe-S-cluster-containing hydrogenase component 2
LKRILVEPPSCVGCRICELACSYRHNGVFSPSLSRVTVLKVDKYGLDLPLFCRQCEICPPLEACPTGALTRTGGGCIRLERGDCIGCGLCVDACPYDGIKLDGSSNPLICDLCGGSPVCVERCPTQALSFKVSEASTTSTNEMLNALKGEFGVGG